MAAPASQADPSAEALSAKVGGLLNARPDHQLRVSGTGAQRGQHFEVSPLRYRSHSGGQTKDSERHVVCDRAGDYFRKQNLRADAALGEQSLLIGDPERDLGHADDKIHDRDFDLGHTGGRPKKRRKKQDEVSRQNTSRSAMTMRRFPAVGAPLVQGALDWLQRAAEERNMGYYMPSVDPIYDPLRSHQRFRSLMQRMNLGHL